MRPLRSPSRESPGERTERTQRELRPAGLPAGAAGAAPNATFRRRARYLRMTSTIHVILEPDPNPGPAKVYAVPWVVALVAGKLRDPLSPAIEKIALRYFQLFPPAAKA